MGIMRSEQPSTIHQDGTERHSGGARIYADGDMAELIRRLRWEETPLGVLSEWGDNLVWAVNLMLESQFANVLLWGPELTVLYNDAYQPLMAEKHPQALGQPASECWSEAWQIIGPQCNAVLENGAKFYFENVLIPVQRQGALRDVYWNYSYSPVRDAGGAIGGVLVVCQDVTEQKRIEKAQRTSELRFRKLFESRLMGIAIPDRFGGFRESNDELLRFTGYTREDQDAGLVRWDTMTPPEYAEIDRVHILEATQHGSCTPYEKEYIRKDGTRVSIICGYAQLDGSRDEYIGFALDLSEQKRTASELREREERFRVLSESLPQMIWMTNTLGENIYCNQRFLDYSGLTEAQMMGLGWKDLIHPGDLEATIARWSHSLKVGEPHLNEYRLRRKDGAYRHFLARAVPLKNDRGEVERWIGSSTDIHDQKLAEEALRKSEKLATAGRLAASIAHEINNPLASVTNLLYLALQDATISADTKAHLQSAEQELRRVAHITTQTLRFHKQSNLARSVDICDIVDSVIALFGQRLVNKNITFKAECQRGTMATCFEDEIRQVIANLFTNAIDATPQEGLIRIRVRTVRSWLPGRPLGVKIVVADSGHGIPVAVLGQIFEPFITTKEATGIGLGLWVSDGIVRKHGGAIRVRSQARVESSGTVFSVFLPTAPIGS